MSANPKRLRSDLFKPAKHAASKDSRSRIYGIALGCMTLVVLGLSCAYAATSASLLRGVDSPSAPHNRINHASFSNGARIFDPMTSEALESLPFAPFAGTFVNYDIDLLVGASRGPLSIPEAALGFLSDSRALWFFDGDQGVLTVALANPVVIDTIRFNGNPTRRPCQPRNVTVWGVTLSEGNVAYSDFSWPPFPDKLRTPANIATRLSKGMLTAASELRWVPMAQLRDIGRSQAYQDFQIEGRLVERSIPVHMVGIEFTRNWGASYTCFAGLGIYGSVRRKY